MAARRAVCLVALAATTNAFFTGTPLRARVAPLNLAAKKSGSSGATAPKTKADPISDECSADDVSAPSADCMDSYQGAPPAQAAQALSSGEAPAGSTGSALVDRALTRLLPTEQQLAYVASLVDRFNVAGPRAGASRGEVSRWIDEVKARFGA